MSTRARVLKDRHLAGEGEDRQERGMSPGQDLEGMLKDGHLPATAKIDGSAG